MRRATGIGMVAAALACAAGARGEDAVEALTEDAAGTRAGTRAERVAGTRAEHVAGRRPHDAARTRRAGESFCELPRVAERSQVSSFRCIACHDGSAGPGVSFVMGPGQSMDHPVEVEYAQSRLGDRHLMPEASLPAEVPLVNGKVACTSCHDGRSDDPKHVAVPRRLCQTCHRM